MNNLRKSKKKNMKTKKAHSEVKRILNSNIQRLDLKESSDIPFIKNFLYSLIKEQEDIVPEQDPKNPKTPNDFTPEQNQKDLESSLDPNTDPSQFDVEGVAPELTVQNIEKVLEWSKKLDEFAMFLK